MPIKTLFLDRDGVINRQIIDGYVTSIKEFEFLPGVLDAFSKLASTFDYIFVITNQQGIGKGIFTANDLTEIHDAMLQQIVQKGGRIDKIYYCAELEKAKSPNRKPNHGMGLMALSDFPKIDLKNAIMVGDSLLDMQFGKNLGIETAFLTNGKLLDPAVKTLADNVFVDLYDFSLNYLQK